jgi:hypothetical protein
VAPALESLDIDKPDSASDPSLVEAADARGGSVQGIELGKETNVEGLHSGL